MVSVKSRGENGFDSLASKEYTIITSSCLSEAGESEHAHTPMDSHPTGHSTEQPDAQSKSNEVHFNPTLAHPVKKLYTTPKIWMDFDDFCSCFTSIVVFHNPRAYHYTHKHTDIKVNSQLREARNDCPGPTKEPCQMSAHVHKSCLRCLLHRR